MNGTKRNTEAAGSIGLPIAAVGERRNISEGGRTTTAGEVASDHAGTSNDKTGENPVRRKPKVSWGR
jgi:hypothetical protein